MADKLPSSSMPVDGIALVRRTLIQAGVTALVGLFAILLWKTAEILLLIFAGGLFAIFLNSISGWISQKTRLPSNWALAATCMALVLLAAGIIWSSAPQFSQQADQLMERLPKAIDQVEQKVNQYEWVNRLSEQKDKLKNLIPEGSSAASTAGKFFTSTFGAMGHFILVLVLGIFLAVSPRTYINGLVQLVPVKKDHGPEKFYWRRVTHWKNGCWRKS
jgi:predicted PurR-regulated permease PerM